MIMIGILLIWGICYNIFDLFCDRSFERIEKAGTLVFCIFCIFCCPVFSYGSGRVSYILKALEEEVYIDTTQACSGASVIPDFSL